MLFRPTSWGVKHLGAAFRVPRARDCIRKNQGTAGEDQGRNVWVNGSCLFFGNFVQFWYGIWQSPDGGVSSSRPGEYPGMKSVFYLGARERSAAHQEILSIVLLGAWLDPTSILSEQGEDDRSVGHPLLG